MTPENHISHAGRRPPLVDSDVNWRDLAPVDAETFSDLPDCSGRNPLALVLLDVIRLAHYRDVQLGACHEVLVAAIGLLADRDRQLDEARSARADLRAQIRACVSGRTIAEERQAIQDEREAGDV